MTGCRRVIRLVRELDPSQLCTLLLAALAALAIGGAAAARAAFPGHNGRGVRELADGTGPAYAPSGTRIAFNHRGVSIMRADGTHRRRVVRRGQDPSFSPGGRRVVFWRSKGLRKPNLLRSPRRRGCAHPRPGSRPAP